MKGLRICKKLITKDIDISFVKYKESYYNKMGANCSSPKTNLRKRPIISKTPSTKHLMHHGINNKNQGQGHGQRSPTKYKTAKTPKEKEAIEQMKYIEAKINKLMMDQFELDKRI